MDRLKSEAEAIAIALEEELVDVAQAVVWADDQIIAGDTPAVAICDVAMAGGKCVHDVVGMLRSVPGEHDQTGVAQRVVQYALNALDQGRDASDVARTLFRLASSEKLPVGEFERMACCFWDDIDLARDGYGTQSEAEVVELMRDAMGAYARGDVERLADLAATGRQSRSTIEGNGRLPWIAMAAVLVTAAVACVYLWLAQ